jgi:hypothetical protein
VARFAPDAPKEVARMMNKIPTMTALSPAFGVSAYGHSSAVRGAAVAPVADAQVSTCARIRLVGDLGHTTLMGKGDFPGTSAWRPPTC